MHEYFLTGIYIYPIKSLGGILLNESIIDKRGLRFDRRWMLVDENNRFLSQRELPQMSQLNVNISYDELIIEHKKNRKTAITIPISLVSDKKINAVLHNEDVCGYHIADEIDEWFSDVLNHKCRLIKMTDDIIRSVDKKYSVNNNELVGFADGYPFLIIGDESLNLLNSKLQSPVPMHRFRPNMVFGGGTAHDEDEWKHFTLNRITFHVVKPCARCVITTIDQDTAQINQEPLKTLAAYRKTGSKVIFGQNLLHDKNGEIRIGDILTPKK
ncbi:MAG: MOSC domain-containing protein [Melioribacteraceae bacterium]|nr:MOSC domain-containing protein [Melioribacteraceae bacterium]MCF8353850.1 MOSC domain-containing protein [Melioribacteraceae bacterium]MCF8393083.1 MOSC domain-containing protein [Melioribacteraceae bacterium]MCF8419202.1 MOSC domain-containing protein [Melioribacteraceae bacterium]